MNASASGPQWDPVHREQLCKLLAEQAHGVDVAQYMAGCTADHSHGPQQP